MGIRFNLNIADVSHARLMSREIYKYTNTHWSYRHVRRLFHFVLNISTFSTYHHNIKFSFLLLKLKVTVAFNFQAVCNKNYLKTYRAAKSRSEIFRDLICRRNGRSNGMNGKPVKLKY